jgi:hypothetical protein
MTTQSVRQRESLLTLISSASHVPFLACDPRRRLLIHGGEQLPLAVRKFRPRDAAIRR